MYKSFTTWELFKMYAQARDDQDSALARRMDKRAGIAVDRDEPALWWQRAEARAGRIYREIQDRLEELETAGKGQP